MIRSQSNRRMDNHRVQDAYKSFANVDYRELLEYVWQESMVIENVFLLRTYWYFLWLTTSKKERHDFFRAILLLFYLFFYCNNRSNAMNCYLFDIEFDRIQHIHFLDHYRIDLEFPRQWEKWIDEIQFGYIHKISVQ